MATCEDIMEYRNKHNRFASYLGIKTTEITPGCARGEMVIKEPFENAIHSVHGGCIFSLADTIGGAAAASHGMRMTTVSSNLHYLLPARNTEKLTAIAKEVKHGKRIVVCDVEVFDDSHKMIAKGLFSYFNLGEPLIADCEPGIS